MHDDNPQAAEAFRFFREHHVENMERMFAAVSDLYARHWHDFFHFALFEDETENWETAFDRTHRHYAAQLRVNAAASVLDVACGRGGFAHFLAEHTCGAVLGIDISRSQLSHCARFRRPNLRFKRHDAMAVDTLGETFDAISFLDAECYLPDKGLAIERMARALRPGGRLLVLAWCKAHRITRLQEELVLEPFMRYWGVPDLETIAGYRRHFDRAGLHLHEASDLNDRVRRNWEFGYARAIEAVRVVTRVDMARYLWKGMKIGNEGLRLLKQQFPAALYIKAGFDAGLLRYVLLLAERPATSVP